MTARAKLSAHIEIIPAGLEHEPVLANLLELYAHDFTDFRKVELGANGRFGYSDLPLYWQEAGRHPFLVRSDGRLAGFVFVKRGSAGSNHGSAWDLAEFFVLRGYRRRGIGTRVAHQIWNRFPGTWKVRVLQSNVSALQFWQRAIAIFTGEQVLPIRLRTNGEHWHLFSFETTGGA
jgi:predicted acetyltransferase